MEVHCHEELLCYARGGSLVCAGNCAEEYGKRMALSFVSFMKQALQLAQKKPSAIVDRRGVERIVFHCFPYVMAFGTGWKQSLLCSRRE